MKLSQLIYFKTVAESGKIAIAAKKLYVSAPALSIAIANLEKELGVQLFERSINKIVLNEQGRLYLTHVNKILEDISQAKQEVQELNASLEESLTSISKQETIDPNVVQ